MTDITDFPWSERNIVENRRLYVSDTVGLVRKKRSKNIHRYEWELVTIDMDADEIGREVKAKISDAADGEMTFIDPRYSYSRGVEPVTGIFANSNFNKGQRDIAFNADGNWQLKGGDYIQFANDTKVYETVNTTPLSSSVQPIRLTHPLRKAVPQNTNVIVNGVVWHFISDGVVEIETLADNNQDIQITLNVVEKL